MAVWRDLACTVVLASSLGCQAHTPATPSEASPGDQPAAATDTGPLPKAFKGYELYAWETDGTLSFALITGTNRPKTLEEVTATSPNVSNGDWVFVRGQGSEALHALLARVPAESSVSLMSLDGLAPLSEATRTEISRAIAER